MYSNQIKKNLFIITSIVFVMLICLSLNFHSNNLMGVSLMSKNSLKEYTYDNSIQPTFLFNDELAPIDYRKNTIYLSQNINELFSPQDLQGKLSVKENNYTLKLIEDNNYNNLYHAMGMNHKFRLVVLSKNNTYKSYNVVFTSLPVICLDGIYVGEHELNKPAYEGNFKLFNSLANSGRGYKVESSDVDWHVRGATSALQEKKPYKLTLKTKNGNNNDLSLLNLGADDDWILNPMNMDDLKIREKVCMEMWEQLRKDNPSNLKMSSGEYVEVLINGKYQGIYLLQRRLDKKYLNLDNDLIFKYINNSIWFGASVEAVYTPLEEEETKAFLNDKVKRNYWNYTNVESFIDNNLVIQVGSMFDNVHKNRMLVINEINKNMNMDVILWDTDMSFGLCWDDEVGFTYDYDKSVKSIVNQSEYDEMLKIYPDLNQMMSNRYHTLTKKVFNTENINEIMDRNYNYIKSSGALTRDKLIFGLRYNNEDTIDKMYHFVEERLNFLNKYFID